MRFTKEPNCISHKTFQEVIKEEIKEILDKKKSEGNLIEYFILDNFGLDLAVFMRFNNDYSIRFFELKVYKASRPGSVGFGTGQGSGPQVDLLLLGGQQLSLAELCMRWIFMDGTKPKGTNRFVFFGNQQAKNAAMGSVNRNKQNNLKINEIMKNAINWATLLEKIVHFLSS